MSYISKNLSNDEIVHYTVHHHWIIFFSWKSLMTLFIYPLLKRRYHEFVITNRRIVIKTGIILIKTLELSLQKVETIHVEQTIFGRIFGYGDIIVVGSGGTKEEYKSVSNPIEFRKQFQQVEFA